MTRVLVVDDDEAIRETLRFVLEDAGYSVVEAANGLEALDMLYASVEPLVVLLDLMMPRLSGAGVLGVVAEDERLAARHAFVLVTANPYPFSRPFALMIERLGVATVSKPFDIDDVLDVVARASCRVPLSHRHLDDYADHLEQRVRG
jgi:two-component system alkaline phosphatase synthesis response regulator PhoP